MACRILLCGVVLYPITLCDVVLYPIMLCGVVLCGVVLYPRLYTTNLFRILCDLPDPPTLAALVFGLLALARADVSASSEEEEQGPMVSFSYVFPENPGGGKLIGLSSPHDPSVITTGKETLLLIGMKNNHASIPAKVVRVSGYLVKNDDYAKPDRNVCSPVSCQHYSCSFPATITR